MVRLRDAVMAVALATGGVGCATFCDECDDFPMPGGPGGYSMMPGTYTGPPMPHVARSWSGEVHGPDPRGRARNLGPRGRSGPDAPGGTGGTAGRTGQGLGRNERMTPGDSQEQGKEFDHGEDRPRTDLPGTFARRSGMRLDGDLSRFPARRRE